MYSMSTMPVASTWGVMEVLSSIERQLTAAAELHFMGSMNEELYISTLRGTLAGLPMHTGAMADIRNIAWTPGERAQDTWA